ncbi:MAG: hypothetical protein ACYCZN_01545 [Candidatus Dormibacteria bacterium]
MSKGDAEALRIEEIGNTYVGAEDRFVVSLVVGYSDSRDGIKTPKEAAAAALALATDGGSADTHWYVYDRKTGEMTLLEQSDFESVPVR